MKIALNSLVHKGGGEYEELEGRRREIEPGVFGSTMEEKTNKTITRKFYDRLKIRVKNNNCYSGIFGSLIRNGSTF